MSGWRSRAACLDHRSGPELWFPVSTAARQQIAEAVAVCRACPVRQECLDDAVATRDVEFGIRAGLMPAARRELAAPRARADRDARAAADAARVVPRLSPRMWSAITAADESGVLAACTPTEVRRSLFQLRVAAPTIGSRVRWADRLNATGMALRAQRLCAGSEGAGGCEAAGLSQCDGGWRGDEPGDDVYVITRKTAPGAAIVQGVATVFSGVSGSLLYTAIQAARTAS